MALETPNHAWHCQASLQEEDQKPASPASPHKGAGESESPVLRGKGRDPELQEHCWQVMHQCDVITVALYPVKPPPSKLGVTEEELKPAAALDLTAPTPMSPIFLQLAMDQCGLRLNEQGELVLTNSKSPCHSLPATIGF